MRKEAGLTQEALAERMGTKKSNISPKISTLMAYAKATGYEMKIDFC